MVYEVTGTGTANSITCTTDGMTSTEQVADVPLPWSKTIQLPAGEAIQMVSVFARAGTDTPEIGAKITVDGKVLKEGKSSGQFAVVTVNDNIGSLKWRGPRTAKRPRSPEGEQAPVVHTVEVAEEPPQVGELTLDGLDRPH